VGELRFVQEEPSRSCIRPNCLLGKSFEELPLRAIVAYAVRYARRVQPLWQPCRADYDSQVETVERGLEAIECFCRAEKLPRADFPAADRAAREMAAEASDGVRFAAKTAAFALRSVGQAIEAGNQAAAAPDAAPRSSRTSTRRSRRRRSTRRPPRHSRRCLQPAPAEWTRLLGTPTRSLTSPNKRPKPPGQPLAAKMLFTLQTTTSDSCPSHSGRSPNWASRSTPANTDHSASCGQHRLRAGSSGNGRSGERPRTEEDEVMTHPIIRSIAFSVALAVAWPTVYASDASPEPGTYTGPRSHAWAASEACICWPSRAN
jgi:hypothetical protein